MRITLLHGFTLLVILGMCPLGAISAQTPPQIPAVDQLLKDIGQPGAFWHKQVIRYGRTKDGRQKWLVSADGFPKREADGECLAHETLWIVAVNSKDGHGSLYSDEETGPSPQYANLLNLDETKHDVSCETIDLKDYFMVGGGITPHQAITLIQDMLVAVDCVRKGSESCGKWKKLDVSSEKGNFLKLPDLKIYMVDWEDQDKHDQIVIRYMLYPPTEKSPYFVGLDCFVKVLTDDSMELDDVTEGGPDP